jgi:hypothetical protein
MDAPRSASEKIELPLLNSPSANPGEVDRRSFLMRNAVIGAAAVMTGTT